MRLTSPSPRLTERDFQTTENKGVEMRSEKYPFEILIGAKLSSVFCFQPSVCNQGRVAAQCKQVPRTAFPSRIVYCM